MTLIIKKENTIIHRAIFDVPLVKNTLHALMVYGLKPVAFKKVSRMSWDMYAKDRETYRLEYHK